VTYEQKIRAIRHYDTSDIHWTYVLEKTELVKQVQWFIELSNIFYRIADELGVMFVDTSKDYEKVIDGFLRNIG
jgi:CMP-2-keto-3-deoxyoctulosonic acid synthetase